MNIKIFTIIGVGEDGRQPLHSKTMDQREIELRRARDAEDGCDARVPHFGEQGTSKYGEKKLTTLHILEALHSHVMVEMFEQRLKVLRRHPPTGIDHEMSTITITPLQSQAWNMFREKGGVTREQLRVDLESVVLDSQDDGAVVKPEDGMLGEGSYFSRWIWPGVLH